MICKGLVALVTGGASGLGKATVETLLKAGNKVVICDLASSKGKEIADELGNDVKFFAADVSNEEEVTNLVKFTSETFEKLNVVVNCAGISVAHRAHNFLKKYPHRLDDFIRVLAVNTTGTFNVIRLSSGLIDDNEPNENNERGVIINTSAFAASEGIEGQVAFATSKAGVTGMNSSLCKDFGARGIRVCSIAPGVFDTPLLSIIPDDVRLFFCRSAIHPPRLGKPQEYAMLVKHIIENAYLNGTEIKLDAGFRIV